MHQLYVITKDQALATQKNVIETILASGVDWLQYRRKNAPLEEKLQDLTWLKQACALSETRLIVNDSIELARLAGIESVHLGQSDLEGLPFSSIKDTFPHIRFLGITAKTIEQAQKAAVYGADYLGVGAIYPSSTKTDAIGIQQETLTHIKEATHLPLYLIGGISPQGITNDLKTIAHGFVVCDYIYSHPSPSDAIKALKEKCAD